MHKQAKKERTLVIIKPDGIQRALIGEIVSRYERVGLKLVGVKMMIPTEELIEKHYTLDPEWRMKTGLKTIKGYLASDWDATLDQAGYPSTAVPGAKPGAAPPAPEKK